MGALTVWTIIIHLLVLPGRHVECSVTYFCVVFSVLYIFCVGLKALKSLRQLIMLYIRQIFGQTLKRKVFFGVGKLGLIHYLFILLCSFQNYLIVSKLNYLLILLLLSLIFSRHKWYCPIRFSIEFHFHHHCIIKFIHHHS